MGITDNPVQEEARTLSETVWSAVQDALRDTTSGLSDETLAADLYAVGGTVRDWALGRFPKDLDVAVAGEVTPVGRRIADAVGGHFFMLHPASQTARVALTDGAWIDLVPLPHGLETDLKRRDFTVNALAAPLAVFVDALASRRFPDLNAPPPGFLVDPTGGWEDLRRGLLRITHEDAFREDPLRPLRGLRLSVTLSSQAGRPFRLEAATEAAIRSAAPSLARVSPERVRDEWLLMMDKGDAADALARAADLGFLDTLVPAWREMLGVTQNLYHHLDVWEHTLDVMRQFDTLQDAAAPSPPRLPDDVLGPIHEYLSERITPPHTRRALVHTAILLHDTGKPATRTEGEDGRIRFFGHERTSEDIAREWAIQWRLSGREREFLAAIVGLHMRPGSLVGENVTLRAIHRFFRDAGAAAPALLLLNAADRMAARGPWTTDDEVREQIEGSWRLLRLWLEMKNTVALPLPISGRDLMAAFDLPPGPQVGRLIQTLRDLHAEVPFTDRETALEAAREWLHDQE